MDLFADAVAHDAGQRPFIRRVHFNAFVAECHRRLHSHSLVTSSATRHGRRATPTPAAVTRPDIPDTGCQMPDAGSRKPDAGTGHVGCRQRPAGFVPTPPSLCVANGVSKNCCTLLPSLQVPWRQLIRFGRGTCVTMFQKGAPGPLRGGITYSAAHPWLARDAHSTMECPAACPAARSEAGARAGPPLTGVVRCRCSPRWCGAWCSNRTPRRNPTA